MTEWLYKKNGEKIGPVGTPELKKLAQSGKLNRDDFIWREGLEKWVKAKSVKDLFSIEPPTVPIKQSQQESHKDSVESSIEPEKESSQEIQNGRAKGEFSVARVAKLLAAVFGIIVAGVVVIWIFLIAYAMVHSIYRSWTAPEGKFLAVEFLDKDEASDSFGLPAFNQALKSGGNVKVTVADVESVLTTSDAFGNKRMDENLVVSSPDGTYYPVPSLVNYITTKGWKYHSQSLRGYVFVRD